jgi:hypothetical protein
MADGIVDSHVGQKRELQLEVTGIIFRIVKEAHRSTANFLRKEDSTWSVVK